MKKQWLSWLGLFLFLMMGSAFAVKVNTLYQAHVPVSSQSTQERTQVTQKALLQVLVKVTGNSKIVGDPSVKSHLKSADTLVQQFGYSTPSATSTSMPYILDITFDPQAVNHLLREIGAPIWGQNRPLLLIWLARETPAHSPEIINNESSGDWAAMFKQQADRRGIPIIFPMMDMTDLTQVAVSDITTFATPKLMAAAERYASDGILMGQVSQGPSGLVTQWKLVVGHDEWTWNVNGKTSSDVAATLMDGVANTLAGRYAVVTTNKVQTTLLLKIIGVDQQADFAQLIRYLNHLTPVADVGIVRITGSEVVLNISLRSTQQSFFQALSLGQKLTPVPNPSGTTMLVYQWNHS